MGLQYRPRFFVSGAHLEFVCSLFVYVGLLWVLCFLPHSKNVLTGQLAMKLPQVCMRLGNVIARSTMDMARCECTVVRKSK